MLYSSQEMCFIPGDCVEEGSKGDEDGSATGGVALEAIFLEVNGDYSAIRGFDSEAIVFYDGSDDLFSAEKMSHLSWQESRRLKQL